MRKLEGLPDGFFPQGDAGSAKVLNVTALVGVNGSGKSTAIRALDQSLSVWGDNGLLLDFLDLLVVRIYRSGEEAQYPSPGIRWYRNPIGDCRETTFIDKGLFGSESITYLQYYEGNSLRVMRFSNSLYQSYPNNGNNQVDISTSRHLMSDWQKRNPSPHISTNHLDTYRLNELERNIQYLADTASHPVDFESPEYLQVSVALSPALKLFPTILQLPEVEESSLVHAVRVGMGFSSEISDWRRLFLNRLYISAIASFIHDWELREDYIELQNGEVDWSTIAHTTLQKAVDDPQFVLHGHGGAQQVLDFLDYLSTWVEEEGSSIDIYAMARIPFRTQSDSRFRTLWEKYKAAVWNTSFLDFEWWGISDGAQNMITLFSRFHDGIRRANAPGDEGQRSIPPTDFLILIDEGTESYHPEWQRKFLDSLMQHLPIMFGTGRRLQIVLATHSPFIVSDLPNACINLLKKGEPTQHGVNLNDRFFGANIHSLFAHSFFMKTTIGEWAGGKIDRLITYLQGQNLPEIPDEPTAQKWIDLVAEPLLRTELQRLLDRGKIRRLENRVEALENQLGRGGSGHA